MNPEIEQPIPESQPVEYTVPWKSSDTWIGVILLIVINIFMLALLWFGLRKEALQNASVILLEFIYILPVVIIFAWRRVNWKYLGFIKFSWSTMGMGCGLLISAYLIILVHNLALVALHIDTQGEEILKIFTSLKSPVWFVFTGVIVAPFVEEIFFRGFLFQGFRAKYGWVVSLLLSSAIFAAAHLDLVSLIPTFVLGSVLAYVYHRSNSLWPGIILHFLVNAMGMCGAYLSTQLPNVIH